MAMRRVVVTGLIVSIAASIALAIAVARIGTQLDESRLDRDDQEAQAEAHRAEAESLRKERDGLNATVGQQLKSIEQLKAELEQVRRQAQATPATQPERSGTAETPAIAESPSDTRR